MSLNHTLPVELMQDRTLETLAGLALLLHKLNPGSAAPLPDQMLAALKEAAADARAQVALAKETEAELSVARNQHAQELEAAKTAHDEQIAADKVAAEKTFVARERAISQREASAKASQADADAQLAEAQQLKADAKRRVEALKAVMA